MMNASCARALAYTFPPFPVARALFFKNSVGKYLVNQATGTRGSLEHFLVLVLVPGQAPRREESTKSAAERFWKGRGR